MNSEDMVLSEISHLQKDKYSDSTYVRSLEEPDS